MKLLIIEDSDIHPIHINLSSVGFEKADDMLEKDALPAPALTDDDQGFSIFELQVYPSQDFVFTERLM